MKKLVGIIIGICIVLFITIRHDIIKDWAYHVMRIMDGKVAIKENDGRYYYMLADKPDPTKAAELISQTNEFMVEFIQRLKKKYLYNNETCFSEGSYTPSDEFVPFEPECSGPLNDFRYRAVYLLVTRYRPNRLEENQPTSKDDTSWEEGKGDRIALCLREQYSGKYGLIDPLLVKFVAIHELTHIAANTLEHPDYFWKVFKFLLIEAHNMLGFPIMNFKDYPTNYCGMTVTYSPALDHRLKMIDELTDIRSLN